eukprot:TRINITY_DN787_c1_g2_i2.p2 TRINITY_DN787_c1_g2~~TRINITY_DN787_c1_g2_i2.p2  ORF type:complete len:216 (-),score=49.07 TRINITY_DN787_c1_g2_i2:21-668(-)
MRATWTDRKTVLTADGIGAVHLGVDRNTGNYIAVTRVGDHVRVHVLDSNFRDIQPSVASEAFNIGRAVVRPNGRLFFLAGSGTSYDVVSVDPVSGTISRSSTTEHAPVPYDAAADERDCLVIVNSNGIITIDSDGNQVAALPIKCGQVAISRDGIVAALMSGTNHREVLFFASNTVESSPPIGRYVLPTSLASKTIAHMVWTDECLLLWLQSGPF